MRKLHVCLLCTALILAPTTPLHAACTGVEDQSVIVSTPQQGQCGCTSHCHNKFRLKARALPGGATLDTGDEVWSYGVCIQTYTNCYGQTVDTYAVTASLCLRDEGNIGETYRQFSWATDNLSDRYDNCDPHVFGHLVNIITGYGANQTTTYSSTCNP